MWHRGSFTEMLFQLGLRMSELGGPIGKLIWSEGMACGRTSESIKRLGRKIMEEEVQWIRMVASYLLGKMSLSVILQVCKASASPGN